MSISLAGEKMQFIWKIENYDLYNCEKGECLKSTEFSVDTLGLMQLELYPKGDVFDNDEYLTLHLNMSNKKTEYVIDCSLNVISDCGQTSFEKISNVGSRWKFKHIIKAHRIYFIPPSPPNDKEKQIAKRKHILEITCQFTASPNTEEKALSNEDDKDLQVLSDEIHRMCCNLQISDFTIKYKNVTMPLHKAILHARVPKLAKELNIDECSEGSLNNLESHPEVTLEILKYFLTFIYSGKIPPLSINAIQGLLYLSDHYEVVSLKNKLISYPNEIVCHTTLNYDSKSLLWTVKDFDKFQVNSEFYGPVLGSGVIPYSDLHFTAKVVQENTDTFDLQVTINRIFRKEAYPLLVQFTIQVVTFTGDSVYKYHGKHLFKKYSEWKIPSFFKLIKLDNPDEKGLYRLMNGHVLCLKTENLSFKIDCFISGNQSTTNISNTSFTSEMITQNSPNDIKTLSSDLSKLYNIFLPKASDVVLHVGDVRFPSHKVILSARSPVFSRMFENEMLEKKNDTVHISDIDVATLNLMLSYFYSGKLDMVLSYDTAQSLYSASDKYDVSPLKEKCISILKKNLTDENVCSLLILADMHSDKILKQFAMNYISRRATTILDLPQWKELMSQRIDLASEIIRMLMTFILPSRKVCNHCSENDS